MEKSILVAQAPHSRQKSVIKHNAFIAKTASKLANKLGATVDLVRVVKLPLATFEAPYSEAMRMRKHRSAKELRNFKIKMPEGSQKNVLTNAKISDGILKQAKKDRSPLIVLGTSAKRGLNRLVKGSVAEEVIRKSTVPVLTINPTAAKRRFTDLHKPKILFATDLGPNSKKAEVFASRLARELNGELIIFHNVYDLSQTTEAAPFSPTEVNFDSTYWNLLRDQTLKRMEKLGKKMVKKGLKCSLVINQEPISTGSILLKKIKKLSPDLVVLGTHGRRFIPSIVLGSTARQVVALSPVPVVTVRSR